MISLTQQDMQTIKMPLSGWVSFGSEEIARRKAQLSTMGPMSAKRSEALNENIMALETKVGMGNDLLQRLSGAAESALHPE